VNRTRRGRSAALVVGLAASIALVTLTSGCDVSPPAATVNGATITQSQLNSRLSDVVNGKYGQLVQCTLDLEGNLPSSVNGVGANTVSTQLASYVLSTSVLEELVSQDLAKRHINVSSSELAAARQDLAAQLDSAESSGTTTSCNLTGSQLLDRLPSTFSSAQISYLADEEQLAVTLGHVNLGSSGILRYYNAHTSEFDQVCLSVIGVDSQSDAQSILGAINSGSSTFAQEAKQNSLLTQSAQNGGAYPCMLTSTLAGSTIQAPIEALSPGQVSQPISETSSEGTTLWLLVRMNGKPVESPKQARSQIRQDLISAQNSRVTAEFHRLTSSAKVWIDPRYGTWSQLRGVQPPVPPPNKYVLSPTAALPVTISSSLGG
jgi:parvulin-like peptidyl-prolyl isomerase